MTYLVSPNPYNGRITVSTAPHIRGEHKGREDFEREIDLLYATSLQTMPGIAANVGSQALQMSETRAIYQREIAKYKNEIAAKVNRGELNWKQGAEHAQALRNRVMFELRSSSSALSRAWAVKLKKEGKTLNDLIVEKTKATFHHENFSALSNAEKGQIYAKIVESSAKSRPSVDRAISIASNAGRGLIVFAIAFSVYNVSTAENKPLAAAKEASILGGGVVGGAAGGAAAGLACGPGAPVCVGLGAFIGGAIAAAGLSLI